MADLSSRPTAVYPIVTSRSDAPSLNPLERRSAMSLASIYALRMLGLFLILPVFAIYAEQLPDVTPVLVGLAVGIYGLTQALLQIPFGLLSDRIGRKPVIIGGMLIFALGSVVAATRTASTASSPVAPCKAAARWRRPSWRWRRT